METRLNGVEGGLDKVEETITRESAETRGMIRLSYVEIDLRFRKLEDTVEKLQERVERLEETIH